MPPPESSGPEHPQSGAARRRCPSLPDPPPGLDSLAPTNGTEELLRLTALLGLGREDAFERL